GKLLPASLHTMQCQPTFGHLARSVFGSSTSGAARSGGAVKKTARPGDGSRSWRMTFSPGPASFIPGPKSASPSNTRGGSRVPEWGPLGSVRGALSNERPYRDLRNVVANYPFESSRGFPGSEPNSGHGDHSRLSCSAGDTQLGLGSAGIFSERSARTLAIMRRRREGTNWPRSVITDEARCPTLKADGVEVPMQVRAAPGPYFKSG